MTGLGHTLARAAAVLAFSSVASADPVVVQSTQAGAREVAREGVARPSPTADRPVDYPGLHNVVAYEGSDRRPGFWSGGAPEGEEGMATLAALGVRTVVSVDGAPPDLDAAHAHGLRYIHLPIGYDGFDDATRARLARAVRDALEVDGGPVYIHCHHGRHRSAGAAASVAIALGMLDNASAVSRMRVSGTAAGYRGLWARARGDAPIAREALDAVPSDFPESTRPDGLVEAMLGIDLALEHLKVIKAADWTVPEGHPDLVPAAEAGRLADLLRLLDAGEIASSVPGACGPDGASSDEIRAWIERDSELAASIEDALAEGRVRGKDERAALDRLLGRISSGCRECHARYRDGVPGAAAP